MKTNTKNDSKPAGKKNIIMFTAGLAIIIIAAAGYAMHKKGQKKDAPPAEPGGSQVRHVSVVTTIPKIRDFEQSIIVQGNLETKSLSMVSPRIQGIIETIYVDEGDAVIANETKLFQTDAVKLKEDAEIGRHNLTVAQCTVRRASAGMERAKADFHKAGLDYERFKRLYEKKAVTADAFEQQQSRYQQLQAAQNLAAAEVDLAAAQENRAKAALAIAEKNLADTTVYAPISGNVSLRLMEPGEMGDPGHPVLRIDDTSVIEVSAFLPAQYYPAIVRGQTQMSIQVAGIDIGRHAVTYKSPTIDPKLRTFEIKCVLSNPPADIAPGAMSQITVVLEQRKGLGVPSNAIQQRGEQSVIFIVRDNTARQAPVETGIENSGWSEIQSNAVTEETPVVIMGQYQIEEGTPVTVQQEAK